MSAERVKVVIVGTGVAGASTALTIRQRLGADVDLVALDAAEVVGGRASRRGFAGEVVEVGGTLLHSTNTSVVSLMQQLGLERARPAEGSSNPKATIGIWDGTRFAFRTPAGGWRFLASLVARYRLRSLRRLAAVSRRALAQIESLYPLLDAGRTFATPEALAHAGGFDELTRTSLVDHLLANGVTARTVDEIGGGILRNMLNQRTRIAALPGFSGLIGAGLAGGSLFSIEGGNAGLAAGALRLAGAEVRTSTRVTEVREDRTVVLADGATIAADIVVLAVPLAVSGITLPASVALPPTRYRRVHVTIVAGRPSARYFGTATPPETIFTTWNDSTPFTSLGRIGFSRSEQVPILKFFSLEPLDDDTVHSLIDDVRAVDRLEWDAYPIMEVSPSTAAFEISPGVYFPNALEPLISTLETETIAGRVVGGLVAERLSGTSS